MTSNSKAPHKLYLHLGLHKTGTTCLQETFYPQITTKHYLQRDTVDRNSLYFLVIDFCFSKEDSPEKMIRAKDALLSALKLNDLIISEEWFTSDHSKKFGINGVTWQEKLLRLGRLVRGLNSKVLLVMREPCAALSSFYGEFKKSEYLQDTYASFTAFIHANHARAYDYDSLLYTLLPSFDQSVITILKYEDLKTDQKLFLSNLSAWLDLAELPFDTLSPRNKTHKTNGVLHTHRHFPLLGRMARYLDGLPEGFKQPLLIKTWRRFLSLFPQKNIQLRFESPLEEDKKFIKANCHSTYLKMYPEKTS